MEPGDNIIFLGLVLAVYEGLIFMCYLFLSVPIMMLLNGIISLFTGSIPEMTTYGSPTLTFFNIMFAIAFIIPVIWFFVSIARVESGTQSFRIK